MAKLNGRGRAGPLADARGSEGYGKAWGLGARGGVAAWAIACALLSGCATFDAPPEVALLGLTDGKLTDPGAPITIQFDKAPVPSSLKLSIAPYKVDAEGLLGDEDKSDETQLDAKFTHDPAAGDTGGKLEIQPDGTTVVITLDEKLPVGAALVLLIEPKLTASGSGAATTVRRRLVFGYSSGLDCNKPVSVFRSGAYFFLTQIKEPVPLQIGLFARIEVDPLTGAAKTRFTKARRNTDPNRCPMPCPSGQACRLLPAPACVMPSTPAGSVDEFSDYVPNPDLPTGWGFAVVGCAVDQDAKTSAFATGKVDVETPMPMVKLVNADLAASFTLDDADVLRGTGSLSAENVFIGIIESGAGTGDLTARSLTDEEAPPDIPVPE